MIEFLAAVALIPTPIGPGLPYRPAAGRPLEPCETRPTAAVHLELFANRRATGCTSILGPVKVTGTSTTPGKLTVGVLVPAPGTWRLFLQCQVNGRILTAPFTLHVT